MKRACRPNTILMLVANVLLFACFCGSAWAKDLYVDGSDSSCTDSTTHAANDSGHPWCTLLRAVRGNSDGNRNSAGVPSEAAQAGDIVHVSAGTYDYTGASYDQGGFGGDSLYESINSGTPGSWITLQAEGAVHLTGNTSGAATMIGSHGSQYIKWVGFTIDQSRIGYRNGNGVVAVFASNVWLDQLHIIGEYTDYGYDDNHTGILLHGPRNGDCTGGHTGLTVSNSSIHGFTGGSGNNDTGMTIYCLHEVTIENNEIYGNRNGIYAKSSYTDSAYRSYIRKNAIHSNTGNAIRMQSWADFDIYQNVIRDNGGACFLLHAAAYTVGNNKPKDMYFVNNTCDNNTRGLLTKGAANCPHFNSNYFYNNIITNATHAIYSEDCTTGDLTTSDIDHEYNVYEHSSDFYEINYSGGTFSTWQGLGQDSSSSASTDCLYADEAANDFRLCTAAGVPVAGCSGASPCLESGANHGVDILELDHDGSTDDAITLGAYITGNEVIGVTADNAAPVAPRNLMVE